VLLRRPLLAAAGLIAFGVEAAPQSSPAGFQIDHTPPACFVADKVPRIVACLTPRSSRANVRLLFRAQGGADWYSASLRFENPCYVGLLPRPSRTTGAVGYIVEAEGAGTTARTVEREVPVVAEAGACVGRAATVAEGARASWQAPPGAPRTPPGFEGTLAKTARAAATPPAAASPRPVPRATAPAPAPRPRAPKESGGHGGRNALLVVAGAAAAGGTAVAVTRKAGEQSPATTLGTGLPQTGVPGVYVGTESLSYSPGCMGVDDVVLNLQGSGSLLSGVLTFTVRTCPCCATGRGANPVSGSLSGTSLQLETPIGFSYSGSFAGNRLSGSLAGPGGVTGTWTVDKR
jgi:hypothetical protein